MSQLPDAQTIDSYGGLKSDAFPVVDPETTESAAEHNALTADVAMMSRMCPRAVVRFEAGDPPADPASGLVHESMWGHALADKPTVARTGTGTFTITWPTEVTNELGESVLVNLRWVTAACDDPLAMASLRAQVGIISPNSVLVSLFDAAGDPTDATSRTFLVCAY